MAIKRGSQSGGKSKGIGSRFFATLLVFFFTLLAFSFLLVGRGLFTAASSGTLFYCDVSVTAFGVFSAANQLISFYRLGSRVISEVCGCNRTVGEFWSYRTESI